MATNFPSSLDSFTNPTTSDTLASVPHASQHADVNDAVEAIETALLDGAPLHIDDVNERVGIGTSTPTVDLEVAGTAKAQDIVASSSVTAGSLTVDTDTLHVDSANDRVGIGTTTPTASLTVTSGTDDAKVKIDSNGGSVGIIDATANTNDATGRWLSINPSGGNVGIGTTSPAGTLDVNGKIHLGGGTNRYIEHRSGNNDILYSSDTGDFYRQDIANSSHQFFTGNIERVRIDSSGNVGIGQSSPSYRLDVSGPEDTASRVNIGSGNTAYRYHMRFTRNGGLLANGIFSDTGSAYFGTPSDVNLKTDISDLSKQDALTAVSALRPVEYRYLLDTEDVVRKGFIAQEMVEVIPEAVHRVGGGHPATSLIYDENGDLVATDVDENGDPIIQQEPDWMVTWEPITTTLVAAVQAQQELIQELNARIEALEAN